MLSKLLEAPPQLGLEEPERPTEEQTREPLPVPALAPVPEPEVVAINAVFARDCLQLSDYNRITEELAFLYLDLTSVF